MNASPDEFRTLIDTPAALEATIERAGNAPRLAVDVESNGLHAFEARLCVLQLAWTEHGITTVAIVDPFAVPVARLAPLLGDAGPIKVLHDLTFDARLLAEAGAPLGRVRDTSVAARLLGEKETGLAAMLARALGVHVDKHLQHHDWARRPLGTEELAYLAGDVHHLLALDEHLEHAAATLGIVDEIADECTYKLDTARELRDTRPGYVKIKGAAQLDATGRATLRRLWMARNQIAAANDLPAFKVLGNDVLLHLANRRPASVEAARAVRGVQVGLGAQHAEAWVIAIAEGRQDEDVPPEERMLFEVVAPTRQEILRHRACEMAVTSWRRREAARRGVNEQVVLPGHCAQKVVHTLLEHQDPASRRTALAQIPGMGAKRLAQYGEALAALTVTSR